MANALILDTFLVPERVSAAVRALVPIPSQSIHAHAHFLVVASGYACYRDSANTARCSLDSTYTITRTSTYPKLTLTSTSPRSTSTPGSGNDNSNDDLGDGLPDGSGSNSIGLTGLNSTSSRSSSSSSTSSRPSPTPSEIASSNVSGAADWKGSLTFFGIAPFFAWIGTWSLGETSCLQVTLTTYPNSLPSLRILLYHCTRYPTPSLSHSVANDYTAVFDIYSSLPK